MDIGMLKEILAAYPQGREVTVSGRRDTKIGLNVEEHLDLGKGWRVVNELPQQRKEGWKRIVWSVASFSKDMIFNKDMMR